MKEYAEEHDLKKCPKCKTYGKKVAGCDYISCVCGGKWCWECVMFYNNGKCTGCGDGHGAAENNGRARAYMI
jgi:hypothetical protein